jgi:hypothetical protein
VFQSGTDGEQNLSTFFLNSVLSLVLPDIGHDGPILQASRPAVGHTFLFLCVA